MTAADATEPDKAVGFNDGVYEILPEKYKLEHIIVMILPTPCCNFTLAAFQ
jgi:hypothetical protein